MVIDKIKETKEYRKKIGCVKSEKMYAPSRELYKYMSKNDNKY